MAVSFKWKGLFGHGPGRLSLLQQVMLTATLALVVAGNLLLVLSTARDAGFARQQIEESLASELESLTLAVSEPVVIGDYASIEQILQQHVKHIDVQRVTWTSAKGRAIQAADKDVVALAPAWFVRLAEIPSPQGQRTLVIGGRDYGTIAAEMTATPANNRLWQGFLSHLGVLGVALGMDFTGIWLVLYFGLKPIKRLEQAIDNLGAGNLSTRLDAVGSRELRHLIDGFNRMAKAQEHAYSELHATQKRLQESQHRLLVALEAGALYPWTWWVDADRIDWQIDPEPLLGPRRPSASDADVRDRVFAEDREMMESQLRQAHGERRLYSVEFRIRRTDDDRPHWIAASGRAEEIDGRQCLVGVAHDITARKQVELELRSAKETAESASLAKSQFLATVSHELRTPMNGILGMAQLFLMPDVTQDERYEYAKTILDSGQTLLTLLNDILDLSKVESGTLRLAHAECDLRQIVEETAALFAESAHVKNLDVRSNWHGPKAVRYLLDPVRLRQMLSNFIANAIKFTQAGFVHIEAAEIEREGNKALLEFSVTDSGIGIPKAKHSLLFERFSQVDGSTTREYGGVGLGLSIVRSLANLMDGDVGVESEPGQGSRFWFRVRADLASGDEANGPAVASSMLACEGQATALSPRHILVVEDDRTSRAVIVALLRKMNLTVDTAGDGQQAVAALTQGARPDLVLMDIQMPTMDGHQATQRIRQWETQAGLPRLPIVALTARAYEKDRQDCLRSGMDDFLEKPIDVSEVMAMLQKWTGQDA